MSDMEVVESFNNAWRALARTDIDETQRVAMNMLARMISKVKSEVEESHREHQITVDEWLEMLQQYPKKDNPEMDLMEKIEELEQREFSMEN